MNDESDIKKLLTDIRERLIQQAMLEQERTSLNQTIIELLQQLTSMSAGEGDDAVLTALAEMRNGIAQLTSLIVDLTSNLTKPH